jgi:hypothetical protein
LDLYHFAPEHLIPAIKKEGLTEGVFPVLKDEIWSLIPRCQWLTTEPDRRKQSWATRNLIQYDRTAYRLTIRIPNNRLKKLRQAAEYIKTFPENQRGIIESFEGSDHWYIFFGKIPPQWIMGCHRLK